MPSTAQIHTNIFLCLPSSPRLSSFRRSSCHHEDRDDSRHRRRFLDAQADTDIMSRDSRIAKEKRDAWKKPGSSKHRRELRKEAREYDAADKKEKKKEKKEKKKEEEKKKEKKKESSYRSGGSSAAWSSLSSTSGSWGEAAAAPSLSSILFPIATILSIFTLTATIIISAAKKGQR